MRILVIDYLSPKGHGGWFKLQIDSLKALGHEVKCIFGEQFNNNAGLSKDDILFQIPSSYYTSNYGIKYRWNNLRILYYIRNLVKEENWDVIIFSSYETISLGIMPIFKRAIVINHNNISDLKSSKIKTILFKRLSKKYYQIGFNDVIASKIEEITGVKAGVVPHGFLDIQYREDKNIFEKFGITPQKYLICPTKTAVDFNTEEMERLCNSSELNAFLEAEGMKMLLRRNVKIDLRNNNHFYTIDGFIENDEYYTLLANCFALILCLKEENFCYRISGAVFESMKLGFPIYVYSNETLSYYEKYNEGNMMFSTPVELVNILYSGRKDVWKPEIIEIASPVSGWEKTLKIFCNDNNKDSI